MKRKNLLVVIFILFFCNVIFGKNNYETGLEYISIKDYENAKIYLQKAYDEENSLWAAYYLGLIYDDIYNDFNLSEKYFKIAADLEIGSIYNNIGGFYIKYKKTDLAEKYFLLSTETGDFLAPRFLGLIYEEQNKLNLAEKYYKIAADRKNFDAYVNLGFLFQKKNDLVQSEKYF